MQHSSFSRKTIHFAVELHILRKKNCIVKIILTMFKFELLNVKIDIIVVTKFSSNLSDFWSLLSRTKDPYIFWLVSVCLPIMNLCSGTV